VPNPKVIQEEAPCSIQSFIRLTPERGYNSAQNSLPTSHTFGRLGSQGGSHPWVSSRLSPGCCCFALMPPCTCRVHARWVWWCTQGGIGGIYPGCIVLPTTRVVYTPPYCRGGIYASLLPGVVYTPPYHGRYVAPGTMVGM